MQDLWQLHGCNLLVEDRNAHGRALCLLCEHAGKWGPCEHACAALLHLGVMSVERTAGQRAPRIRGCPAKRSEGNQLPQDVERANVPAGDAVPAPGSDHAASPLTDILARCWACWSAPHVPRTRCHPGDVAGLIVGRLWGHHPPLYILGGGEVR